MEKKLSGRTTAVILIAALLAADAVLAGANLLLRRRAPFALETDGVTQTERMRALNGAAHRGTVRNEYAFYQFTPRQTEQLSALYQREGAVSVTVRIGVRGVPERRLAELAAGEQPFCWGYLVPDDFDSKGRFLRKVGGRPLVRTDLRALLKSEDTYFDCAFAVEKNLAAEKLPCGILVYSALPADIYGVRAERARVGFDFTGAVPFYGLASTGGAFSAAGLPADFSGCEMVFPAQNTPTSVLPKIEISLSPSSDCGTPENPRKVRVNAGGETLTLYGAAGVSAYTLQTALLAFPFSRIDAPDSPETVTRVIMSANSPALIPGEPNRTVLPLVTEPGLIIRGKSSAWRSPDYELYQWERFPHILIFDTRDYAVQRGFFRRLAFFAEKKGYRGKILTDGELGDMHGYNAHDYSAESLAAFFTEAARRPSVLSAREYLLRDILVRNGVIVPDGDGFRSGEGAVIAVSQESQEWLRQSFIAHECWHGIFFTDEDFRNATAAVYYTIDSDSLDFITGYWASQPSIGYDPADLYLMHNEFMAYLMQQPLGGTGGYFVHLAGRGSVMRAMPELCAYVRRTSGAAFEDAARIFDSYAFDRWGLACGRVSLVTR